MPEALHVTQLIFSTQSSHLRSMKLFLRSLCKLTRIKVYFTIITPSNQSMDDLTTRCAESIAYLHMLHPIPAQPQPNCMSNLPKLREGYTLLLEQERNLAGVLAFLSRIRNNNNYIPAVCIKESRKPSSLDVLIAVNKGRTDDGNDMLRELEDGFGRLFEILARVHETNAAQVEREAFSLIVSLCSARILYRLRFKKSSSKTPIKKVLQDVLSSLQALGLSSRYPLIVKKVKDVVKLIDAYSKHQTQDELEALIESIRCLQKLPDVSSVLGEIPNRLMAPSSKTSLLSIIRKVARYRNSASFLFHLANECSLVRRMKVVQVQLGPGAFRRAPVEHLQPTLASKLSPTMSENAKPYPLQNTCRLLGTTVSNADLIYAEQTRKTLEEGKVHAEIQLIFYCEEGKYEFPPRVVCSSKDACFLCNTFISMYGKMHTPRSHGKLYPGWRLPQMGSTGLHSEFVAHLDSLIRDSLNTLVSRGTKTVYVDPNESTLLTLPASTLTLCSQGVSHEATVKRTSKRGDPISTLKSCEIPSSEPHSNGKLATVTEETERSTSCVVSQEEILDDDGSPISPLSQLVFNMAIEGNSHNSCEIRLPEIVKANQTSPFYSDGVLEVLVEYSTRTTTPSDQSKKLPFRVEWIDEEEAKEVRESQAQPIVDAESMEGEISLSLDDHNSVFILARGSLVKITFGPPVTTDGGTHIVGAEENDSL
ncbi:hypothetical protein PG990_002902 [Apiospora arundinis]